MTFPTAVTTADFARNLASVRTRIDAAAARAGRDGTVVRLLPVSKTVPVDRLRAAVAAGMDELAENKVQEAERKSLEMADLGVRWAVIGHLQSNKARNVAAFATEFHAVDSARIGAALDRRLQLEGRQLNVFVQVNTSGEEQKSGVAPARLPALLRELAAFDALRVQGLMTLALFSADPDRVRPCFALLRELRDRAHDDQLVGPGELSMGMSGDFELAIEEGSTCVRVGQAIFGSRTPPLPPDLLAAG
jgi:pyridoxal phosphate enzyme (YggS family)